MKLVHNVPVTSPNGKDVKVTVEVWGRKNSECSTWIIRYKNRRIAPYEQRLRGWSIGLNGVFRLTYSDHMKDLIADYSPFLSMVRLKVFDGSPYPLPVITGTEDGVEFGTKE